MVGHTGSSEDVAITQCASTLLLSDCEDCGREIYHFHNFPPNVLYSIMSESDGVMLTTFIVAQYGQKVNTLCLFFAKKARTCVG